jgi:hypothetical protein
MITDTRADGEPVADAGERRSFNNIRLKPGLQRQAKRRDAKRRLKPGLQRESLPRGGRPRYNAATTRSPTCVVPCPILPAAWLFIFVPVTVWMAR